MKPSFRKGIWFASLASTLTLFGCTPSNEPTGPEAGSVQEYLDANPEAAARIDEGREFDDGTDDGTGE